ncbi:MAG: hypothetical protein AAB343_03990 [Patescibacteria group bacterium]
MKKLLPRTRKSRRNTESLGKSKRRSIKILETPALLNRRIAQAELGDAPRDMTTRQRYGGATENLRKGLASLTLRR